MENKSIVIITAHCDDQEKIDILVESINELKSQGYPIIVSTHIQVPEFIYEMVDYVVYDKENPIIYNHEFNNQVRTWLWASYGGFYQEYTYDFNHGYAVLKLIKNGVGIAQLNGYDISHVVCYDYIIKDQNLLKEHIEVLKEYDVYSYEFKNAASEGVSVGLFSFKNNIFLESFGNVNSKKDYSDYCFSIFELFVLKLFQLKSAKIFKRDINDVRTNNVIDKVTLSGNTDKNFIQNKDKEKIAILFLTKVSGNYYIYFISFRHLTLNINIGKNKYQLIPNLHKSNLISIKESDLQSLVKIEIPEVEITDLYTLETRHSDGRIDNVEAVNILKLEDIIVSD